MRILPTLTRTIIALAILGGCASKPPASISKIPHEDLTLTRVRLDLDQYMGSEVRWGGTISKVENKASHTWIELVRQPLRENGKPRTSGKSDGRFIASFEEFVDPVVYEIGRPLTVVGTIEAKTKRLIGDYDYLFPIVTVEGSYLWKAAPEVQYQPYPYYDPWFYHPWHHHRHPIHH